MPSKILIKFSRHSLVTLLVTLLGCFDKSVGKYCLIVIELAFLSFYVPYVWQVVEMLF